MENYVNKAPGSSPSYSMETPTDDQPNYAQMQGPDTNQSSYKLQVGEKDVASTDYTSMVQKLEKTDDLGLDTDSDYLSKKDDDDDGITYRIGVDIDEKEDGLLSEMQKDGTQINASSEFKNEDQDNDKLEDLFGSKKEQPQKQSGTHRWNVPSKNSSGIKAIPDKKPWE